MDDVTIAQLAEGVAEEQFQNEVIAPLVLIERLGITWSFGRYQSAFDGLIEYADGRFHIYLNQDRLGSLEAPRTRFTAAHELGHYFIDEHRNTLVKTRQAHPSFIEVRSDLLVERQADHFASNFLLPEKRFRKKAISRQPCCRTILALAETFNCSVQSTAIRYALTHPELVVAMFWGEESRHWCWSSEAALALTRNKAHKSTNKIPQGSVTHEVFHNPVTNVVVDETRGSLTSSWFPTISPGSSRDKICRESAVQLGGFGVLTVLWLEP
ncbi:MAG: ImmA/IrrE family metallo-endopeptidase [bacterium]